MKKIKIFNLFFLWVIATQIAFGQNAQKTDFPPLPNPPRLVNDLAHILSAEEIQTLEIKLVNFSKTTSNQITVITIPSIGNYEVADYATKLGNYWKVGKSGKDNGVVILAAIQEHKINISVGQGLEGALTDMMCGRIISNEMKPAFKSGNFFQGFSDASDAVIAATKGEYQADPEDQNNNNDLPLSIPQILLLIIVSIIILYILSKNKRGPGSYMSSGGFGGWMVGSGFGSGGGFGSGSSSGGGFGGFGGGGFGGGGASGDW